MRNNIINSVSIILAMVLAFMMASNALSQDMGSVSYKEGYGSYDMMGQDPDEIMKYGQDMMRYGFHEMGMPGGSNKYPGYSRHLNDKTIKKLNAEQKAFIKATEDLRQTIYEKELYLKAELVKKDPDTAIALSFQNNISEARGKFEQKMIEHLIRMKKINLEAERK
ncbi:periplasmic heavy metal sensor [Thermodesulfobacteriota bacterium]